MAIDRSKAISDFSKLRVSGNENGLIPAFGVLVNNLPSDFWNTFSEKILQAADDDLFDAAEGLLEHAAAECGYHTGHGIMTSEEFDAVIGPMIEKKPEDIMHGVYAVFSAWGWANFEIVEIDSGKRMVVRAYDYYEADVEHPKKHFAYMIRGISRALMDLIYSDEYPHGMGKFKCVQTKGIEMGDDYGEFVVTPV